MEDYDSIQKSSSQPGTHIMNLTSKPPTPPHPALPLIKINSICLWKLYSTEFSFYLGVEKHRNISADYLQKVFSSRAWILIGVQE